MICPTRAATNSWVGSTGKWEASANWSLGIVPAGSQAIFITNTTTKTVTIDSVTSADAPGSLQITNLTISAPGSATNTLSLSGVELDVRQQLAINSGGNVVISNGTLQAQLVGISMDINGQMTLQSGASLIATNGTVAIGFNGVGNVTLNANSTARTFEPIIGTGSGVGTLTVNGGTYQAVQNGVDAGFSVGSSLGSTGTVWVTGGTLISTNASSTVGIGNGSLILSNGAVRLLTLNVGRIQGPGVVSMMGGTFDIGAFLNVGVQGGTGDVFVTGGQLTVTNQSSGTVIGSILLGSSDGLGRLTISNGTVLAHDVVIGSNQTARGELNIVGGTFTLVSSNSPAVRLGVTTAAQGMMTVAGGNVIATNAPSFIGEVGVGALIVSNGTMMTSQTTIGLGTNSQGSLTLKTNGQMTVTGSLTVGSTLGATGNVDVSGGQLIVTNGTFGLGDSGTAGSTGGVAQVTVSGGLLQAATILVGDSFGSASSFTISSNGHVVVQGGLRVNSNHTTAITDNGILEVLVGPPPLFEDPVLNNRIVVAYGADGTMLVSNGTVNAPEMVVGLSAGNTGSLVMNGGIVSLSSNLLAGLNASATGLVMISGGTLTVTNGTFGVGSTGGVAHVTVSGGLLQAASILVGDNFGNPSSFTVGGSGHVVVQGGMRVNGNHTTTVNGGTVEVLVGPVPAFEDPVLRNRIVVGYGADGTMIVSNGVVRTPALVLGVNAGNTGTLELPGGSTSVFSNMTVGLVGCTSTGIVNVTGGSLYVTNGGTAVLEVRSGTFTLSAGTVVVDKLVVTNACARLVRTGGTLVYSQLVLDPNLSAVGDSIPNGWKQQYSLDPFNPNLANADADGDGMSNLQEFLAGTDPTNSTAAFRITSLTRTGNNVTVTWTMGSGKTNALQRTAGAGNGTYQTNNFTDLFIVTNTLGTVTNYLDVGAATNFPARYYRVRLVP